MNNSLLVGSVPVQEHPGRPLGPASDHPYLPAGQGGIFHQGWLNILSFFTRRQVSLADCRYRTVQDKQSMQFVWGKLYRYKIFLDREMVLMSNSVSEYKFLDADASDPLFRILNTDTFPVL